MKTAKRQRLRFRLLLVSGVAAAFVVGVGTYATAATVDRKYTGCLKNGQLSAVAVGTSPSAACAAAAVQITWNESGPAGAAGPQGTIGPRGAVGPRGPEGPVEAVNAIYASVPDALTVQVGFDLQKVSFTTTNPGRLLVTKQVKASVKCDTGSVYFFATVDGVPVRGSAVSDQSRETSNIDQTRYMILNGVTSKTIAAGTHTLGVGAMCPSGRWTSSSTSGQYNGTAVVVGSGK